MDINPKKELELFVEELSEHETSIMNYGCCWACGSSFTSASTFGSCAGTASTAASASCGC